MIYHPGHFHGISHEADIHWMINLPETTQVFLGDGIKTRFKLKHEARFLGGWTWTWMINPFAIVAICEQEISKAMVKNVIYGDDVWYEVKLDLEDSKYIIITPALIEGQLEIVDYHYVRELD